MLYILLKSGYQFLQFGIVLFMWHLMEKWFTCSYSLIIQQTKMYFFLKKNHIYC